MTGEGTLKPIQLFYDNVLYYISIALTMLTIQLDILYNMLFYSIIFQYRFIHQCMLRCMDDVYLFIHQCMLRCMDDVYRFIYQCIPRCMDDVYRFIHQCMLRCMDDVIRGGSRGGGGPGPPFQKVQVQTFIVATEKKSRYTLLQWLQGKKHKGGGAIRNPKKNPGIDFYSGFRGNAQVGIDFYSGFRKKNPGIYFYSGFRKKNSWGVQFEILKTPGIDFHSGFRKTSQGGGAILIHKKVGPP